MPYLRRLSSSSPLGVCIARKLTDSVQVCMSVFIKDTAHELYSAMEELSSYKQVSKLALVDFILAKLF
jgi:hypothetical protein